MSTLQHYLRPLLAPSSVALVGATSRAGSLGRVVARKSARRRIQGRAPFRQPAPPARARPALVSDPARDRQVRRARADRRALRRRPLSARRRCPRRRPRRGAVVRTAGGRGRRAALGARGDGDRAQAAHPAPRAACVRRDPHRHRAQRDDGCSRRTSGTSRADRAVGRGVHGDARTSRRRSGSVSRPWSRLGAATTSASASCSTQSCATPTQTASSCTWRRVRDARSFLSALRAAARTKPVVVLRAGRSRERGSKGAWCADAGRGIRRRAEARGHRAREDVYAALRGRAHPRDGTHPARVIASRS